MVIPSERLLSLLSRPAGSRRERRPVASSTLLITVCRWATCAKEDGPCSNDKRAGRSPKESTATPQRQWWGWQTEAETDRGTYADTRCRESSRGRMKKEHSAKRHSGVGQRRRGMRGGVGFRLAFTCKLSSVTLTWYKRRSNCADGLIGAEQRGCRLTKQQRLPPVLDRAKIRLLHKESWLSEKLHWFGEQAKRVGQLWIWRKVTCIVKTLRRERTNAVDHDRYETRGIFHFLFSFSTYLYFLALLPFLRLLC